jgi:hypothetical protein
MIERKKWNLGGGYLIEIIKWIGLAGCLTLFLLLNSCSEEKIEEANLSKKEKTILNTAGGYYFSATISGLTEKVHFI